MKRQQLPLNGLLPPTMTKTLPRTRGCDSSEDGLARTEGGDAPVFQDQDTWLIEGDYLVRKHKVPRTALFSPTDVPDEPPPIDITHVEVLRVTCPKFTGILGLAWTESKTAGQATNLTRSFYGTQTTEVR